MAVIQWLRELALIMVLVAVASWAIFQSNWFQRQFIYPSPLQQTIFNYAEQNNLDPYLIAAVIRAESKFDANARSPKGAIGLMQVMPETGRWVAEQIHCSDYSDAELADPDTNIRIGTWYLASLEAEFQGNDILMLAAYNGGRGNVQKWMRELDWPPDFKAIEQIPFKETSQYVKKVLRARDKYRELYPR